MCEQYVKYYEWLASLKSRDASGWTSRLDLRRLPPQQSRPLRKCGGQVEIQIRDLAQTVIGNPSHDLIRLGLSLASAAGGSDLPGVTTAQMLEELMAGYEADLPWNTNSRRERSRLRTGGSKNHQTGPARLLEDLRWENTAMVDSETSALRVLARRKSEASHSRLSIRFS
jgi:uncharacterized protein (DUF2252 family)